MAKSNIKYPNMDFKRTIHSEKQTASRMLDAAETLFSQNGVEQTSIRQITQKAKVNIASVNYYFGSKEDLVEAVFERLVIRVTQERRDALTRILAEAHAAGRPPRLEDIVSSFIQPYLGEGNDVQGMLMARFMLRQRLNPTEGTRRIVKDNLDPLAKIYVEAFAAACPDIDRDSLLPSYLMMTGTVVLTTTENPQVDRLFVLSKGKQTFANRQSVRDQLVRFIVGGISNPKGSTFMAPVAGDGIS